MIGFLRQTRAGDPLGRLGRWRLLLLVGLLSACAGEPTPQPAPTPTPRAAAAAPQDPLPPGWTLYAKPGAGFGLALAPGWQQAAFETADFAFTPLADSDFSVELLAVQEQANDGGSFPSTLAVIALDLPGPDSFDELLQKNIEMADALAMPGSAAIIGDVQLFNAPGVQVTTFTTSIDIGTVVPRSVRNIFVDAGDVAYLISATALANRTGDFQRELDGMIRSFRLLPVP